jgi:hypothetical protein
MLQCQIHSRAVIWHDQLIGAMTRCSKWNIVFLKGCGPKSQTYTISLIIQSCLGARNTVKLWQLPRHHCKEHNRDWMHKSGFLCLVTMWSEMWSENPTKRSYKYKTKDFWKAIVQPYSKIWEKLQCSCLDMMVVKIKFTNHVLHWWNKWVFLFVYTINVIKVCTEDR